MNPMSSLKCYFYKFSVPYDLLKEKVSKHLKTTELSEIERAEIRVHSWIDRRSEDRIEVDLKKPAISEVIDSLTKTLLKKNQKSSSFERSYYIQARIECVTSDNKILLIYHHIQGNKKILNSAGCSILRCK